MSNFFFHFGRFLLISSFAAQGYLSLSQPQFREKWNGDFARLAQNYPLFGTIVPFADHLCTFLGGLQLSAIILLFSKRVYLLAILNALGLVLIIIVTANPFIQSAQDGKEQLYKELLYNTTMMFAWFWNALWVNGHIKANPGTKKSHFY